MQTTYTEAIEIRRGRGVGGAGVQDPDTGLVVEDPAGLPEYDVIWQGKADVQDKPTVINRDQTGAPTLMADAVCFVSDESIVANVKINDIVLVTWPSGAVSDAEVMKLERFDGVLYLRRL